ncbi:DUF421 domain-containing protein [Dendrosporobacter sp. 1207_IL3150]|uniref:DUF421 domain-containing protein n=1 Tax=Dendrosporobacter sp. 1207_IL3150 TaxID=3084054 RepID=UPI002FDB41ED
MDSVGAILFRVVATLGVILIALKLVGQRRISELNTLEAAVFIVAATAAGTVIADSNADISAAIIALIILGAIQFNIGLLTKMREFNCRRILKPIIIIEDGSLLQENLKKLPISTDRLLELLRGKDVFNINEVEIALFEPSGNLSVLKKARYQPITPNQLNLEVEQNLVLVPVIIDGNLQEDALKNLGFSVVQIAEFEKLNKEKLNEVFVAFMDKEHNLHLVNKNDAESKMFIH